MRARASGMIEVPATPSGAPATPGVLLAGGLARRMGGGDKARIRIGGETILARVLQRLTPGGYDLVFVDSAHIEYPGCYELGVSLLRRGGIIAFHNVLAGGRVIDPSHRDPETLALREVARAFREDERLVPALLPVGGGLLVAAAI